MQLEQGRIWSVRVPYASREDIQRLSREMDLVDVSKPSARAFRRGEVLCYYTGAQIKIADMLRKSRKGPQGTAYVMGFGLNKYLDAEFRPDVLARYLNDSKDKRRYNVYFNKQWELRRAEVVALRDIAPGEELFVSYGANYWKVDGRQQR